MKKQARKLGRGLSRGCVSATPPQLAREIEKKDGLCEGETTCKYVRINPNELNSSKVAVTGKRVSRKKKTA